MKSLIQRIDRIKKPLFVLFILLNLTAVFGLTQIKINTSFDIFKTQDSEYIKNQALLEENFPSSDQMIVVIAYTEENRQDILDFQTRMDAVTGVKMVKGLDDAQSVPFGIEALSTLKTVADQTYAIVTVFPDEDFSFSELKVYQLTQQ